MDQEVLPFRSKKRQGKTHVSQRARAPRGDTRSPVSRMHATGSRRQGLQLGGLDTAALSSSLSFSILLAQQRPNEARMHTVSKCSSNTHSMETQANF